MSEFPFQEPQAERRVAVGGSSFIAGRASSTRVLFALEYLEEAVSMAGLFGYSQASVGWY